MLGAGDPYVVLDSGLWRAPFADAASASSITTLSVSIVMSRSTVDSGCRADAAGWVARACLRSAVPGSRGARRTCRTPSHSRAAAAQQSGRAGQAPPMPAVIPGLARCSPLRRFAR